MTDTEDRTRSADHCREEDWVDFARQLPPARERLAGHLASGCARCARSVRLWSAVSRLAAEEASYEPPAESVRQARQRFALQRPPRLSERVARVATLVFDSFRQPLPAAVRSAGASPRQMLFRAGRYVVKLRLETQGDSERMSIVGQVLDEQDPALLLHDISVLAVHGRKTLDRALTNELGEFLLEPAAVESLQLSVALPRVGTFTIRPGGRGRRTAGGGAPRANDRGRGKRARPR